MTRNDGKVDRATLGYFGHGARATALGQAGQQLEPRWVAKRFEELRIEQFIDRGTAFGGLFGGHPHAGFINCIFAYLCKYISPIRTGKSR